jgi:hypothetical protein
MNEFILEYFHGNKPHKDFGDSPLRLTEVVTTFEYVVKFLFLY